MLSIINRKKVTTSILVLMVGWLIFYIIYYAYNATIYKTQNLTDSAISFRCLSSICIIYDNVKECIHIDVPTLFRIEMSDDINYLRSNIREIDYISVKEDCK